MKLVVTIAGDDVLRRRLRALGDVARGQVIMDAVEAGGRVLEAEAKLLAPWDLGALRASIDTVQDGVTATSARVKVGPAVHYGAYVEFGTGIHAEGGGGRRTPWVYFNDRLGRFVRTSGSPAQPYLRPALRQRKSAIVAAISATLRRLLDAARRR